jgi:hypothetical protein
MHGPAVACGRFGCNFRRIVQMPPPMISNAEKTNDLDIID